jgi:SAM-dependent methyltransferase
VAGRPGLRPELVDILRCPETGQKLVWKSETELITDDGARIWRVDQGRPILFPGLEVVENRGDQLSNDICLDAQELIGASEGLVLNLSAGGSREKNPKVVEVEAAIFRNTDIVADAHRLPFADGVFDSAIALNAFEHFRNPAAVATEIARVLRPGGEIFVHTAFLQPAHEAPWHFYNATKYGLLEWFSAFSTDVIRVSENFNPIITVSWLSKEIKDRLEQFLPPEEAEQIMQLPLAEFASLWEDLTTWETHPAWPGFQKLPNEAQEGIAAGFEFRGRRR